MAWSRANRARSPCLPGANPGRACWEARGCSSTAGDQASELSTGLGMGMGMHGHGGCPGWKGRGGRGGWRMGRCGEKAGSRARILCRSGGPPRSPVGGDLRKSSMFPPTHPSPTRALTPLIPAPAPAPVCTASCATIWGLLGPLPGAFSCSHGCSQESTTSKFPSVCRDGGNGIFFRKNRVQTSGSWKEDGMGVQVAKYGGPKWKGT